MKPRKYMIFYNFLFILLIIGTLNKAQAAQSVSVARPKEVTSITYLPLMAEVVDRISERNGRGSYRLLMKLPTGLIPSIKNGSSVNVTIPTIHQNLVTAKIISINKQNIELIISNQVQQLEGQTLKVDLPVLPNNLYKIPFQSILSPRGLSAEVFILSGDMKVRLVQVTPLHFLSDGAIVVSSEHLKNSSIVVQGTDNLLSGDSVQIYKEPGALL